MSYQQKYLKYKTKYLELKNQLGGKPPLWTHIFDLITDKHTEHCTQQPDKKPECKIPTDKIKLASHKIANKLKSQLNIKNEEDVKIQSALTIIKSAIDKGTVDFNDNNIKIKIKINIPETIDITKINKINEINEININVNIDKEEPDIQLISNIAHIIDSITYTKDEDNNKILRCNNTEKNASCSITDTDKENIANFLAHVIPKCKKADITVEDIKAGKILGKGAYGYSYLTKRNNNNHKIIKINIYTEKSQPILETEKTIHMEITKAQKRHMSNYFAELYGYFSRKNNTYTYTYLDDKYQEIEDCKETKTKIPGQELYIIMEAGQADLFDVANSLDLFKVNKLIISQEFIKLLNFYKISNEFCKGNKILIHHDIKPENLILMINNEIKIIDFGFCLLSGNFFNISTKGTPDYVYMAFGNKQYISSPLYDIFCVIYSLFIVINIDYMTFKTYKTEGYSVCYEYINTQINTDFKDYPIKNKLKRINLLAYHIYLYHSKKFSAAQIADKINKINKIIFNDFHTLLTYEDPPCKDVKYSTDPSLSEICKQMKYLEDIVSAYLS
jgi:serine/threonine protein kinase